MTGSYELILPLMISNMSAYALARHLRPTPIYDALLHQNGYSQILTPAGRTRMLVKAFGAACREVEIQDLTFHDLRHTFASRLREAGVDAITRRDLLGHSTVEMSDDYTHSSAESRLRAVQSIADYRKQDYSNFTTNQDSETPVRIAS